MCQDEDYINAVMVYKDASKDQMLEIIFYVTINLCYKLFEAVGCL